MKYARMITPFPGAPLTVADIFTPPAGKGLSDCFAPGLVWIDCTANPSVMPGWTYDGVAFAPPAAPVAPSLVPPSITMWQAQYILHSTPSATPGKTLLDDANAAIAAGDMLTSIAWTRSATIDRSSGLLAKIGAALGISDTQIDAMFIAAANVKP